MSQHSNREMQLLQLVQQRDTLTAQINALLQDIVAGSSSAPIAPARVASAPAVKAPAGKKGKKRGRPVGWRKATSSAAPAPAKAAPAAGAAPKKRGRPVGWRKAAGGVVPELAAAKSKAGAKKKAK